MGSRRADGSADGAKVCLLSVGSAEGAVTTIGSAVSPPSVGIADGSETILFVLLQWLKRMALNRTDCNLIDEREEGLISCVVLQVMNDNDTATTNLL